MLETKKRTLKKGPRAIRQDLKKKGIDKSLQDEVLESFTYEEQLAIAMQLAEKEVRAGNRKTPTQVKQKIQDVLMRKGYSFSIVSDVLERIQLVREEDEWEDMIAAQGEKIWRKFAAKFSGTERNMKVKQALYQKGFPIEVINRFIEEKEHEEV